MLPGFEIRFLNAGRLVKGVVSFHALAIDMPRMFPPDVLYKIQYRTYVLPLRGREWMEREISWFLARMEAEEREWVLKQPFAAKLAEYAGTQVRL